MLRLALLVTVLAVMVSAALGHAGRLAVETDDIRSLDIDREAVGIRLHGGPERDQADGQTSEVESETLIESAAIVSEEVVAQQTATPTEAATNEPAAESTPQPPSQEEQSPMRDAPVVDEAAAPSAMSQPTPTATALPTEQPTPRPDPTSTPTPEPSPTPHPTGRPANGLGAREDNGEPESGRDRATPTPRPVGIVR